MKRRLLSLATRPLISTVPQPWICRRCMAQAAVMPAAINDFLAPSAAPQQSLDLPTQSTLEKTATAIRRRDVSTNAVKEAAIDRLLASENTATTNLEARRKHWRDVLASDIKHDLPPQYLMYIDESILTQKEKEQRKQMYAWAMPGHVDGQGRPKENARELKGVVISTGLMNKTVKVRIPGQRWEPMIKKYYASHKDHLVHDPNNTLIEGDLVILHRLQVAKQVEHVVGSVVVAYGTPLDQRPPIPTPEERLAIYKEQRLAKLWRRHLQNKTKMGDTEAAAKLTALAPTQILKAGQQDTAAQSLKTGQQAAEYIARLRRKGKLAKERPAQRTAST